jgi:translocation and assembly module TamA
VASGCASIPEGNYGVNRLTFRGVDMLDREALRACLATEQRRRLTLGFTALRAPECGRPPFDRARLGVSLFAWPWTPWPIYDEAVFRLDLQRIERWYQARGYYGARIAEVSFDPHQAGESDVASCGDEGCPLRIAISIEEGPPTRIRAVTLRGHEGLPEALRERLDDQLGLEREQIFDEALYERARGRLAHILRDAGYARVEVKGNVLLDRVQRWADVSFRVEPGALHRVGSVRVKTRGNVPREPILAAAKLTPGSLYSEDNLEDAQRSIYALGAFSAVTVRGELDEPGERVDIVLEVEPRRESQWMVGGGIMNGTLTSGTTAPEWVSVPQWDLHLSGSWEHRNFLGGLRRLRVEERPRMLFLGPFPSIPDDSPRFGNLFEVQFAQPGVFEPRTSLISELRWDQGPDPFLLFFRHVFGVSLGLERGFLKQRLKLAMVAHQEFMYVSGRQPIALEVPSDYVLPFLEQRLTLDLRNDAANPDYGAFFGISAHEAFKAGRKAWNYLRLTPEVRGYIPLGLGLVLAARFAIGWLHIFEASAALDDKSARLGPQPYRLRGGGAQSNRGFRPGELGDGVDGGTRRWEHSIELRVPVTQSFTVALFMDMGDVHAGSSFRFTHLNTALGGGLRYRTLVGPIRFDVGVRPKGLQRTDGSEPDNAQTRFFGKNFEGAVHLTIGEPF